jgi:hypothetical protein
MVCEVGGGGGATHSINIQIDTEWQRRARELQAGESVEWLPK